MHAFALALLLAAPPEQASVTLDEKIAAALKNHPDVRAAEAKKLLAEAELEQARLVITQKVSAASSRVEMAKAKVLIAEEEVKVAEMLDKLAPGAVSQLEKAQYMKARPALIGAKAELAAAELELHLLVGKGVTSDPKVALKDPPVGVSTFNPSQKMPTGAVIDKLELVVRRQVVLDLKDMTFADAIASIVGSPDEIIIRGGKVSGNKITVSQKTPLAFEAAVQLLLDEYNRANIGKELEVYVREYGLLVEHPRGVVPKDAIPLSDFIRAVKDKKK